ncbi:ribose 5-phosphate isomerase B [Candidatus Woesearchaeota archaeon]|nr:ribose 5-phosphate isomerase B [Candidatus Woesearchaeota archaeon]
MEIIIGSDHGGYGLKEKLKKYLSSKGISSEDVGAFNRDSCDYPDLAAKLSRKVLEKKQLGIIICGTGLGVCMASNKFMGIRAALCYDKYTAKMAREHNDANVLCLGGRTIDFGKAKQIADTFLNTETSTEERHKRRVEKISEIEKNNFK